MNHAFAQPYGADELVDDLGIGNEELLVRHITIHHLAPAADGSKRLSSQAFKSRKPGRMSVNLVSPMLADGFPIDHPIHGLRDPVGIATFVVAVVREYGDGVAWTPKPLDERGPANPYHADVLGFVRDSQAKNLLKRANFQLR